MDRRQIAAFLGFNEDNADSLGWRELEARFIAVLDYKKKAVDEASANKKSIQYRSAKGELAEFMAKSGELGLEQFINAEKATGEARELFARASAILKDGGSLEQASVFCERLSVCLPQLPEGSFRLDVESLLSDYHARVGAERRQRELLEEQREAAEMARKLEEQKLAIEAARLARLREQEKLASEAARILENAAQALRGDKLDEARAALASAGVLALKLDEPSALLSRRDALEKAIDRRALELELERESLGVLDRASAALASGDAAAAATLYLDALKAPEDVRRREVWAHVCQQRAQGEAARFIDGVLGAAHAAIAQGAPRSARPMIAVLDPLLAESAFLSKRPARDAVISAIDSALAKVLEAALALVAKVGELVNAGQLGEALPVLAKAEASIPLLEESSRLQAAIAQARQSVERRKLELELAAGGDALLAKAAAATAAGDHSTAANLFAQALRAPDDTARRAAWSVACAARSAEAAKAFAKDRLNAAEAALTAGKADAARPQLAAAAVVVSLLSDSAELRRRLDTASAALDKALEPPTAAKPPAPPPPVEAKPIAVPPPPTQQQQPAQIAVCTGAAKKVCFTFKYKNSVTGDRWVHVVSAPSIVFGRPSTNPADCADVTVRVLAKQGDGREENGRISRFHFTIECGGAGALLFDGRRTGGKIQASTNGTFIEERRVIRPIPLAGDGVCIKITPRPPDSDVAHWDVAVVGREAVVGSMPAAFSALKATIPPCSALCMTRKDEMPEDVIILWGAVQLSSLSPELPRMWLAREGDGFAVWDGRAKQSPGSPSFPLKVLSVGSLKSCMP
jgi:hypothetical protein